MGHMQADLAAPPFAPEHEARAREVAEFLRAHGAWDGGAFVTLESVYLHHHPSFQEATAKTLDGWK
ncbi:hypothetical protein A6024_01930 [Rhodovulum sulfidophilum]|nr:hypothetical protein A6W98_01945 [Rhodovulum sulfidophilum DSM 1374]ANB36799.1 hypothetical protein A6024_01930 [Rhodovulum sulfidophilum]